MGRIRKVHFVPVLRHDFSAVVEIDGTDEVLVVDPREKFGVTRFLKENDFRPGLVLNTEIDGTPLEGDELSFHGIKISVLAGPHASGSLAFFLSQEGIIFVGSSLSPAGLGRIDTGDTVEAWWRWIEFLKELPVDVNVLTATGWAPRNSEQEKLPQPVRSERERKQAEAFKERHKFLSSAEVAVETDSISQVNAIFSDDFEVFQARFQKEQARQKESRNVGSFMSAPNAELFLVRVPPNRPKKGLSLDKFTPEKIADLEELHHVLLETDPRIFSDGTGCYRLETLRWSVEFEPGGEKIDIRIFGAVPSDFLEQIEKLAKRLKISIYDAKTKLPKE